MASETLGMAMFIGLKYRRDLTNAQRQRRETQQHYRQVIAEAKDNNASRDAIDELIVEEIHEVEAIDDHIGFITSQYWKMQAEHYLLPLPPFDAKSGIWVQGPSLGRWRLNVQEVAKLRSAVRKEAKESREHWQVWITLAIGFTGTLIGLVSLLVKK
jgi:hypothetical protein